jgi:hypothetical protein
MLAPPPPVGGTPADGLLEQLTDGLADPKPLTLLQLAPEPGLGHPDLFSERDERPGDEISGHPESS